MKTHISEELQDKILNDLVEDTFRNDWELPVWASIGSLTFDENELDLYNECIEWREVITTYFLSSYTGGALKKFGPYEHIRPDQILHNKVIFTFEDNKHMSWKDWFIRGEDYAKIT